MKNNLRRWIAKLFIKIVDSDISLLIVFTIFAVLFSELFVFLQLSIFYKEESNHGIMYNIAFWTSFFDAFIIVYFVIQIKKIYEKKLKEKIKSAVKRSNKLNERLELALLGNNDGVWDWNLLDNSLYLSPRWKEMLGYDDDELPSEFASWEDNAHPDDLEKVRAGIQENIDAKTEYYEGAHRMKHKDGSWIWVLDRGKTLFDKSGKAVRMIGTHTDVTAEKEVQSSLKKSNDLLKKLSNNVPATIYQFRLYPDGRSNFPYASVGIEETYEVTPEAVIDDAQAVLDILHPDDLNMIMDSINQSARTMQDWNLEYRVNLPKKGLRWLQGQAKPEKLEDGSVLWHGFIADITDRKIVESQLREQKDILHYQAHHDSLTGLANRVLFNDRLERAIEKAKRAKSNLALLFIDLDHFKEINDSLGHTVGDEILKVVTSRLSKITRGEDTLARLGGDEFTIIIENLAQGEDATYLAQKIINVLAEVIIIEENELYVSSSIGISLYPTDGGSAANLLKYADSAMYKAKNSGRNNFQFYSAEMTELAFERVVMETALRTALQNEEFIVYYQPQVDAMTNSITGMEALVRWQHPTMGLISPARFIPLAENTGLIVEIDQYVMRTAMTQMTKWVNQGLLTGILYMNLAVKQLQQKDFIETLKNLMKETECKAKYLGLEVTEGQIMTNPEEAIVILNQVSAIGIELAIDDFGTGYSSLSYLKKLPIDKLKIDQSFVRDLPNDEEDAAITKAVIALAKSLNLKIIAEGVETKEQKEFLVQNGCMDIQGYYYSKPVPANEFEAILRNGVSSS